MFDNLYPVILYLEDGMYYKGWSFFKLDSYSGEIVFNTGMIGYQEILTDPSYSGQMVVFTYPELGNTGLNCEDNESSMVHVKAIIAKNISMLVSNWRSTTTLRDFLVHKCVPHIFGVDTRSLTRHVRSYGVMNAILCNTSIDLNSIDCLFKPIKTINFINKVTTISNYFIHEPSPRNMSTFPLDCKSHVNLSLSHKFKILVIDFGVKLNILKKLLQLGFFVIVASSDSSYEEILQYQPDAILLSNGPGDPMSAIFSINTVKKLILFSKIPIFGICMGHQILSIALGANTFKLKFGHRGLNHPSGYKNYSEITSQNHGFAVDKTSLSIDQLSKFIECNFCNLNDLTVSGILHKTSPILSVQYHPEASPGPHDSDYLFRTFFNLVSFMKSIH